MIIQMRVDGDSDHDHSREGGGNGQVPDMSAGRTELASVRERESKEDTQVSVGRMELPPTKMGETVRGAGMKGCVKHWELCFDTSSSRYPLGKGAEKLSTMDYRSSGERLLE